MSGSQSARRACVTLIWLVICIDRRLSVCYTMRATQPARKGRSVSHHDARSTHNSGRRLFARCRSGRPRRVRAPAGVGHPSPRAGHPLHAGAHACRALAPLPSANLVARPAGPACGLDAGPGRVDPRPVRSLDRVDVPPSRHRAGASGLAGAVPRHRGVRWQCEGGPRRSAGMRAAVVGKSQRNARDRRSGHGGSGRHGNGLVAVAPGCCCRRCIAGTKGRCAIRRQAGTATCVPAAGLCP